MLVKFLKSVISFESVHCELTRREGMLGCALTSEITVSEINTGFSLGNQGGARSSPGRSFRKWWFKASVFKWYLESLAFFLLIALLFLLWPWSPLLDAVQVGGKRKWAMYLSGDSGLSSLEIVVISAHINISWVLWLVLAKGLRNHYT